MIGRATQVVSTAVGPKNSKLTQANLGGDNALFKGFGDR